jgi:heterodisulfide reductase subunit A-like polyferredoxin
MKCSQRFAGLLTWKIINKKNMRCEECLSFSPLGALDLMGTVILDGKLCNLCGIYEKACPVKAMDVTRK